MKRNTANCIIEWHGILEGNVAVVLFMPDGKRRGYVGVENDHPFYGKHYRDEAPIECWEAIKNTEVGKRGIMSYIFQLPKEIPALDILFDVHGSVTYADHSPEYPVENEDLWWFGFDCSHAGDAPDVIALAIYYPEVSIDTLRYSGASDEVRSLEYCKEECLNLSKQLNFFKELLEKTKQPEQVSFDF